MHEDDRSVDLNKPDYDMDQRNLDILLQLQDEQHSQDSEGLASAELNLYVNTEDDDLDHDQQIHGRPSDARHKIPSSVSIPTTSGKSKIHTSAAKRWVKTPVAEMISQSVLYSKEKRTKQGTLVNQNISSISTSLVRRQHETREDMDAQANRQLKNNNRRKQATRPSTKAITTTRSEKPRRQVNARNHTNIWHITEVPDNHDNHDNHVSQV